MRVLTIAALAAFAAQPSAAQEEEAQEAPQETGAPNLPTPMSQRVVTIGVLDKVSTETAEYKLRPGQRVRYGALNIGVAACEKTPPWTARDFTGAFLQVSEGRPGEQARRIFSGWLYAESPSLNSLDHPAYDIWVKACAMDFPETDPETIVVN